MNCKKCNVEMSIPDDLEPTDYCNTCAQEMVIQLRAEIRRANAEVRRLKRICTSTHDRLLRGEDDISLIEMLQKAWKEAAK